MMFCTEKKGVKTEKNDENSFKFLLRSLSQFNSIIYLVFFITYKLIRVIHRKMTTVYCRHRFAGSNLLQSFGDRNFIFVRKQPEIFPPSDIFRNVDRDNSSICCRARIKLSHFFYSSLFCLPSKYIRTRTNRPQVDKDFYSCRCDQ